MEKIYMNENKRKKRIMNTSVVLSFVVSIFAIFSLAMFGIVSNQKTDVSYAALPSGTTNFTFRTETSEGQPVFINVAGNNDYRVPLYYASVDDSQQIFCVEHTADVDDVEYQSDGDITDFGLLYLLNNSYATGKKVTDATGTNSKYVETWVTQTAIWVYLAEKYPSDTKHTISAAEIAAIESATTLTVTSTESIPNYVSSESIYTKYVRPLIDAALSASNTKKIDVSKASDDISKTRDEKFYQSSIITVTGEPSSDLKEYDIKLSGIDGAFVVDENGNKIENLSGITPGTKFYVRIPVDKVTDKVQKLTVHVDGHFKTLAGKYYVAASGNYQKVVSVTDATIKVPDEETVEFVGTPDTGMNKAQTIYFIGLIVLLCGVGIVYANAKPVQEK